MVRAFIPFLLSSLRANAVLQPALMPHHYLHQSNSRPLFSLFVLKNFWICISPQCLFMRLGAARFSGPFPRAQTLELC